MGWHGSRPVPRTDSVRWSAEAKLSSMTLGSAAPSDRLVLAVRTTLLVSA